MNTNTLLRKIFPLILVFIAGMIMVSCLKDKTEYVNHESEIFLDRDTLFIGNWEYLYTWSEGGYTGEIEKTIEKIPPINIMKKGNYEIYKNGSVMYKGKIDTVGYLYGKLLVRFYPNGIKNLNIIPQTIETRKTDTLILGLGLEGDWFNSDYYKRIK